MRLAWGMDQVVADWVRDNFEPAASAGRFWNVDAVGFVRSKDGRDVLVGGLVMSRYRGFDAHLSIYTESPRFVTPDMLNEMFEWAFLTRKLRRLTCVIAEPNTRARRFVEHLGFTLEGRQPIGYDGIQDACIYGMTRDACPWTTENGYVRKAEAHDDV